MTSFLVTPQTVLLTIKSGGIIDDWLLRTNVTITPKSIAYTHIYRTSSRVFNRRGCTQEVLQSTIVSRNFGGRYNTPFFIVPSESPLCAFFVVFYWFHHQCVCHHLLDSTIPPIHTHTRLVAVRLLCLLVPRRQ